jgi:hypothetical protein
MPKPANISAPKRLRKATSAENEGDDPFGDSHKVETPVTEKKRSLGMHLQRWKMGRIGWFMMDSGDDDISGIWVLWFRPNFMLPFLASIGLIIIYQLCKTCRSG